MLARTLGITCVAVLLFVSSEAFGQSFGVEANNALMPASGAMGWDEHRSASGYYLCN